MENYTTCANAIFDEKWGEYKCRLSTLSIYDSSEDCPCGYYKKGTPNDSKENENYADDT